jgi:flavodoxin
MNMKPAVRFGQRLKISLFCLSCLFSLLLTGCGLIHQEAAASPDPRTGPNLVIFFAENGATRRTARAIAQKTGGDLFDIRGKKPLPDLLNYDTFFVGGSLKDGRIPQPLADFFARTDFIDGRVIPFWTSREKDISSAGDLNGEFQKILRGGRFLRGGGFRFDRWVTTKEINRMVETWAASPLAELELRRAAGGDQAEDMTKLFSAAYSDRLGPAVFEDGQWTFEMDGIRWYYAQGRFLPQEDADRSQEFRPLFLYRYALEPSGSPESPNPWQQVADQVLSRRLSSGSYRSRLYSPSGAARSPFYENLWQSRSKTEAFSRQQWITFLGWPVQIHRGIAAPLDRVQARIAALTENDPEIQGWIKSLHSITGWNWRNIAGSENRSFHAYGVAVDLLMKAQPGMETYWQWTAAKGIDWRSVPTEKKQNPPAAVIRIFEEQGFIWGGRWSWYDTMHFEYHPELLILGTGRKPESTV